MVWTFHVVMLCGAVVTPFPKLQELCDRYEWHVHSSADLPCLNAGTVFVELHREIISQQHGSNALGLLCDRAPFAEYKKRGIPQYLRPALHALTGYTHTQPAWIHAGLYNE